MVVKKERARERQLAKPQIKSFDAERYAPTTSPNQERNEFIDKLGRMADWFESLKLRIERRQAYLEIMNGFAGYDDLAMEVRDFNAACDELIASKKRRVA